MSALLLHPTGLFLDNGRVKNTLTGGWDETGEEITLFLDLKIQGPALPFQEISDPFLSLLPAVPRGLLPCRGLEEASEQRNLMSP